MNTKEIVAHYDRISSKRYDALLIDTPISEPKAIDSILSQNADMETFVVQAAAGRTFFLGDVYTPLTFVHFSDIHASLELWNRIADFTNHYKEYLKFAIHTGDYCGDSQLQFRNLYEVGTAFEVPVLNCIGNHDTYNEEWKQTPKQLTHSKIFSNTDNWKVEWIKQEYPSAYFKDFTEANVRLIVLDQYYEIEAQRTWLRDVLSAARKDGKHVITAMHEHSATVTNPIDVSFQTITPYEHSADDIFDDLISEYIKDGGIHICNLTGHYHADWFGRTDQGVLNVSVECAADWAGWCDGSRIRGTRTYDSFNVVSIDTNTGLLKLVRIGNQADLYLRSKKALCYNYLTQEIISNT